MDPKEQILKNTEKPTDNRLMNEFPSDINFFIKDKNFLSITKKTERLVSALYLLTDMFPDQEPLKWSLRKYSLNIIPPMLALKSNFKTEKVILNAPNPHLLKLHSFLETAYMSGLVSNMNFSLLQNEIFKLIRMENEYLTVDNKKDNSLDENYFRDDYKGHVRGEIKLEDGPYEGSVSFKNIQDSHKKLSKRQDDVGDSIEKNVIRDSVNKPIYLENSTEKKKKKNERQVKIIDLIKNKVLVSIKDISDNIKGCGEKTIQRELMAMVKSGVLKKEGERRWSKYSLNL